MKTTSTFKIKLIDAAIRDGMKPLIYIRGVSAPFTIAAMKSHNHTAVFTLDKLQGFLVVEPDEIASVWVTKLPTGFAPEAF